MQRFYKMKKSFTLFISILIITLHVKSQERSVLDIMLTNYEYPFKVEYFYFKSQQQELKMAYMDIFPDKYNGKDVILMHKCVRPLNGRYAGNPFYAHISRNGWKNGARKPIGLEDWKTVAPYTTIDQHYENELQASYESTKEYQLTFYHDNNWKHEYDEWVYLLTAWNNAQTADMIFTQPVLYEFQNIEVPTLLIIGTRDKTAIGKNRVKDESVREKMGLCQYLGKETQNRIHGSKLVELDNIGHLPHIESFDLFINPLREFLKN